MITLVPQKIDNEDEATTLRNKLRMIVSHATGGALHKPEDIDRSTNDICVEISRMRNVVWEQAKEVGRAEALKERS